MTSAKWGTLAQALELAPSEEELVRVGRNGDIQARITHHYRAPVECPLEYWNGMLDLERSRIRPCFHVEYDEQGREHASIPWWRTVQVDLQSVKECFGLDQQPAEEEERRGLKKTYDWEQAGLEIFGKIYHGETSPEPSELNEVCQLYTKWFAAKDKYPAMSKVYDHARKLLKVLKDSQK